MDDNETRDVDDRSEPRPTPPQLEERGRFPWAAILVGIWAIALVIFSVQNAEDATIEFLGWSFNMPVALLVIVTALITLVVTGIGFAVYRGKRRREVSRRRKLESDD